VQEAGKPATTFTYYEPSGLVQSVTSPSPSGSGTVTHTLTYDALGNVLTVTGPGNNAAATVTTTFNYTTDGAYSQAAALGQPLTVTDPRGKVSHFRFDAQGRPVSAWDPLGNTVGVQYNLAGQSTVLTLPATGQSGAGNGATETVYLYPGGPAISAKVYNESGTLVRQVDTAYDAEGRPLQVTGSTEPVRFEYDGAGRQWRRYDGNNHLQSEYLYHPQGWLAQERKPQPGGGWHERSYGYDTSGRVTSRTDGVAGLPAQIGVTYHYDDPDGLLTEVRYPGAPARNVLLGYDGYGRLTTRTDGTGVQTYSYGDLDQLLTATTTYTGLPAQALSYTYYPDGSRSGMSTPAGQFSYLCDAAGQATSLTNPFGETTGWSYRDNGWLQTQTLGNGVTSTYVQNALGQLTSLLNQTGGGTLLSQFSGMVHDGAGNRLSVTANVPGAADLTGAVGYQYDTKDQLTQETSALGGGFTSAFGYDPAGNPTLFKGATRSYDGQNRRSDVAFAGATRYHQERTGPRSPCWREGPRARPWPRGWRRRAFRAHPCRGGSCRRP
jgi:YD repeat-containing protein